MAFTQLNSFLLTTDGRVFSWGGVTTCLGRDVSNTIANEPNDRDGFLEELVDEVDFSVGMEVDGKEPTIVQIATGRSHVLALDTDGNVYAWGHNDYG